VDGSGLQLIARPESYQMIQQVCDWSARSDRDRNKVQDELDEFGEYLVL
jgi:hypothetical protein